MAGVIKQFGPSYVARFVLSIPASHLKAMRAIERCRTPALGGQVVECSSCRVQDYAYHSCRHRACPRCMSEQAEQWLQARRSELLPVPYFHVVFSLPKKLHHFIRTHRPTLYPLLMSAAAAALQDVAADPKYLGGTIGVMATLHTWSRTLFYHPHVHCLVPAGALDEQGRWQPAKRPHLAPKKVLNNAFRDKLCDMIAAVKGLQIPTARFRNGWKVFVEQPKHGADTLLRYLARSLYRGPLDDHSILDITDRDVLFEYPDRDRRRRRAMRLDGHEFLRRFLQHVWPNRIHKVRYFGLWSRKCRPLLEALRQDLLAAAPPPPPVPAPAEVTVTASATAPHPSLPHWLKCPLCSGQRVVICHFGPGVRPPLPSAASPPPTAPPP
jgi:hypothetical protein